MNGQRALVRAVNETELTEKDNVAGTIERLLHEVQAARVIKAENEAHCALNSLQVTGSSS
jgi:hypothetical protein